MTKGARLIDLDAAGDHQLGLAGLDGAGGGDHRIHARAAEAVDGRARNLDSGRPASSSAMRATLRLSSPAWLAQPKITSSTASQSTLGVALHQRLQRDRAEIVGADRRQRAAEAADRRADIVADEGFGASHAASLLGRACAVSVRAWRSRSVVSSSSVGARRLLEPLGEAHRPAAGLLHLLAGHAGMQRDDGELLGLGVRLPDREVGDQQRRALGRRCRAACGGRRPRRGRRR